MMSPEQVMDCCAEVPAEQRDAAIEELLGGIVAIHTRRGLAVPSWVDQVRQRLRSGAVTRADDGVDQ
jgi:hypothetical protein